VPVAPVLALVAPVLAPQERVQPVLVRDVLRR